MLGRLRSVFVTEGRPALLIRILGFFVVFFAFQVGVELAYPPRIGVGPTFLRAIVHAVVRGGGIVGLVWLFRRFVDRRPWKAMKLDALRPRLMGLLLGWIAAAVMIGLLFAVELGAGWIQVVGYEWTSSGARGAAIYALGGFLGYSSTGISEELAVRGYLFQNLGERYPLWLAAALGGVLFGLMHFGLPNVGVMFVASLTLMTAMLVLSRLLTGSIWPAIGWHWAWDFTQDSALGLSSTGEPAYGNALLHLEQHGPAWLVGRGAMIEGGALVQGVELLGFVALALWARRSGRVVGWRGRLDVDGDPRAL